MAKQYKCEDCGWKGPIKKCESYSETDTNAFGPDKFITIYCCPECDETVATKKGRK